MVIWDFSSTDLKGFVECVLAACAPLHGIVMLERRFELTVQRKVFEQSALRSCSRAHFVAAVTRS
jgi:hypothetical protein